MKIIALVYDFPHKKSQEGLFELCLHGQKPDLAIGAPPVELNFYHSKERIAPRGLSYGHPRDVCRCLGIPYVSAPHNSDSCIDFVKDLKADLGIVLGARIIKQPTILAFRLGILNMHPGILPDNRGLDNLKWSILNDLPIGVTAHLIDESIDRGRLVCQETVPVFYEDTIRDVFLRQQDLERKLMLKSIRHLRLDPYLDEYPLLGKGTYYRAVPPLWEQQLDDAWRTYRQKHGSP